MRDYKLIAIDIDGTLLNSELKVTDANKKALDKVVAAGKYAVLCTGRCFSEIRDLLKELPQISFLICENGGCVYDIARDHIVHFTPLPEEEVRFILDLIKNERVALQVFSENQSYITTDDDEWMERCGMGNYREFFNISCIWDSKFFDSYDEKPFCVEKINLYMENESDRQRLLPMFADRKVKAMPSFGYMIETVYEKADKGVGLKKLCEYLNISVEDTIAVGDSANDVEVLKVAGLSAAMGNAGAVAKEAADVITADCDHDGVAQVINEYMV